MRSQLTSCCPYQSPSTIFRSCQTEEASTPTPSLLPYVAPLPLPPGRDYCVPSRAGGPRQGIDSQGAATALRQTSPLHTRGRGGPRGIYSGFLIVGTKSCSGRMDFMTPPTHFPRGVACCKSVQFDTAGVTSVEIQGAMLAMLSSSADLPPSPYPILPSHQF